MRLPYHSVALQTRLAWQQRRLFYLTILTAKARHEVSRIGHKSLYDVTFEKDDKKPHDSSPTWTKSKYDLYSTYTI